MIRICNWCGKFLGVKRPWFNFRATHGICAKCKERVVGMAEEIREERWEREDVNKSRS